MVEYMCVGGLGRCLRLFELVGWSRGNGAGCLRRSDVSGMSLCYSVDLMKGWLGEHRSG
jgi:hypothetical protein